MPLIRTLRFIKTAVGDGALDVPLAVVFCVAKFIV